MEICKSNGLGSMSWVKISELSKQFIKRKKFKGGVTKAILKKIIFNFTKQNGRYLPNEEFFVKRLGAGRYSLHNKICIHKFKLFQNKIQNGFIISKEEAVYLSQDHQLNINARCAKEFKNITEIRKIELLESDFQHFTISLSPSDIIPSMHEETGGEEGGGGSRENRGTISQINMDQNNFFFVPQNFQNELRYENIPESIYPVCKEEPMDVSPSSDPSSKNILLPSSNNPVNENAEAPTSNPTQYLIQYPTQYPTQYPAQYSAQYPTQYPAQYSAQYPTQHPIQSTFLPDPAGTYFIVNMECNTGEGNIPNYTSVQFPTMVQVPSMLLSSPPSIPTLSAQVTTPSAQPEQLTVSVAPPVQHSTPSTSLPIFAVSLSETPSTPSISSSSMPITYPKLHAALSTPPLSSPVSLIPSTPSVPKTTLPPAPVTVPIVSSSMSLIPSTPSVLNPVLPPAPVTVPIVSSSVSLIPSTLSVLNPALLPAPVTVPLASPVKSSTPPTGLPVLPVSISATPSTQSISSSLSKTHPVLHALLSTPPAPLRATPVPSAPSVQEPALPSEPVPCENPIILNLFDMISEDEDDQVSNKLNLIESKFTPEDYILGI